LLRFQKPDLLEGLISTGGVTTPKRCAGFQKTEKKRNVSHGQIRDGKPHPLNETINRAHLFQNGKEITQFMWGGKKGGRSKP